MKKYKQDHYRNRPKVRGSPPLAPTGQGEYGGERSGRRGRVYRFLALLVLPWGPCRLPFRRWFRTRSVAFLCRVALSHGVFAGVPFSACQRRPSK